MCTAADWDYFWIERSSFELDPIESNDHHCHVELVSIFYRYKKLAPCTAVYSSNERSGIKTVVIDTETDTVNSSLQTRDEFQPSSDRFFPNGGWREINLRINPAGWMERQRKRNGPQQHKSGYCYSRKRQNEPPNGTHVRTRLLFWFSQFFAHVWSVFNFAHVYSLL